MDEEIEFDWDEKNRKHLAAHKIKPAEFEQVMRNEPLDLDCAVVGSEDRFRSVGITDAGRLLVVVWTVRDGKIRAVTAFPPSASAKRDFLETRR